MKNFETHYYTENGVVINYGTIQAENKERLLNDMEDYLNVNFENHGENAFLYYLDEDGEILSLQQSEIIFYDFMEVK